MVTIYTLLDPRTNLVRYVGKTAVNVNARYSQHIYQWKRCKGQLSHLNSWIKNLAKSSLLPTLEIIDEVSDNDWVKFEMHYIKLFKSFGCNLVNSTVGGEGICGHKMSKESINKRNNSLKTSTAWKEKHIRHSNIMKIKHLKGDTNFGYKHLSKEKRIIIGNNHSIKMKEHHKKNKSHVEKLIKSRQIPVESINVNGETLKKFNSASEAGRFYNIDCTHITKVCKEKSKQTHGFRFKYSN